MAKLQEQLKQRKPFRNVQEEAILNLWHTGDSLAAQLQHLLKKQGVSQTQYNVLRILRGAGDEGLPSGEIGMRMLTRDPDITRLLDRMVRRGLARRTRVPQDRRVVLAKITPKGVGLLAKLDPVVNRLMDEMVGHLKNGRLQLLIDLLEELRSDGKQVRRAAS